MISNWFKYYIHTSYSVYINKTTRILSSMCTCSFLFISYILSGCGTISGDTQIISVDTSMKEVEVYELETNHKNLNIDIEAVYQSRKNANTPLTDIGKTPLFYKTKRTYSKNYILEKDGILSLESLNCSIRWKESVFPDTVVSAAMYFVNPIISLLAISSSLSIDAISGSVFDCRDRIFFNFPDKYTEKYIDKKEYQLQEARFILIPLPSKDKKISQKYTDEWQDLNLGKFKRAFKKISFVPKDFVKNRLEVYGINIEQESDTLIGMDLFRSSQLLEFGYSTNATHIIFINKKNNKIESSVIDLHSLEDVSENLNLEPLVLDDKALAEIYQKKWYFPFMKFFPNSYTLSFPISSYIKPLHHMSMNKDNSIQEYDLDSKEDRGFDISGDLDRIEHFKKYSIMDLSFLMYFNLNFISESRKLIYIKPRDDSNVIMGNVNETKAKDNLDIRVSYFNILISNNIGLSLHTGLGSINTLLILGPSIERYRVDSYTNTRLNLVYGLRNDWSYFINDKLFIFCSATIYRYLKKNRTVSLDYELYNNDDKEFKLFSLSSSYYIKVGMGYYFGNSLRDWVVSLFDSNN